MARQRPGQTATWAGVPEARAKAPTVVMDLVAGAVEADVVAAEREEAGMVEAEQVVAREAALTATAARVKASEEDPMATADVAAEVTAVAHLAETRSSQLQCHWLGLHVASTAAQAER